MGLSGEQLKSTISSNLGGKSITVQKNIINTDGTVTVQTENIQIDVHNERTAAFIDAIAQAVVSHIKANLDIEVPSSSFIISVVGQATGAPNPAPVKCLVN